MAPRTWGDPKENKKARFIWTGRWDVIHCTNHEPKKWFLLNQDDVGDVVKCGDCPLDKCVNKSMRGKG